MGTFRQRIREAIADQTLQTALDNNAERRLNGRAAAFASIPDWRDRRRRAHTIREEVIEQLDLYLERFIAKNKEHGVIVHRAADSSEALNIILQIARTVTPRGGQLLVAKSKSMVSEEIELNHELEKENIRVVETDLGEYIVQLRHERPSHIITPAAHLKREQVGELFAEKLGIPYTTDIPTLTATARRVLREVFLQADIGLSGVNFGVAETGTVCMVTNEGNGRMVATVPPVHIALMGMERLVPDLEDLALMLSLLPRSATGQKLSVYTQMLNQPLEGQTRHLVILDNGRSRLRNSPLKESLYCIRCGACLNACPVFRELGGHAYIGTDQSIAPYPGPIGSIVSPGLLGERYIHLAQASSLCGACKDACPVDIDLPKLLTRVRAGQVTPHPSPDGRGLSVSTRLGLKLYTHAASHPRLYAMAQKVAAFGSFLISPRSSWMKLPAFSGWGLSKDFPRFAQRTFRDQWRDENAASVQDVEVYDPKAAVISDAAIQPFDRIERFTSELTALGGQVQRTKNPTADLIGLLKGRGISKIHLQPGLLEASALQAAGIECVFAPDAQIQTGVTNALCGLADTGSVLIADGEGNPLQGSLLPEVHIAILKASGIVPSLPDAMERVKDVRAAVFISGPSRTADIEMTLTIGVHGPKELHVFMIE